MPSEHRNRALKKLPWIIAFAIAAIAAPTWLVLNRPPEPSPEPSSQLPSLAQPDGRSDAISATLEQATGSAHPRPNSDPQGNPKAARSDSAPDPVRVPKLGPRSQKRYAAARTTLEEAGYYPFEVEGLLGTWSAAEAQVQDELGPHPALKFRNPSGRPDPRLAEALYDYDQALRAIIPDDEYDLGRYALGMPNRVEIFNVPENSASMAAGFMDGDIVESINGQTFYTKTEVRKWFQENHVNPDARYPVVTVRRGDQIVEIVSDGPRIGNLQNIRVKP